MQHMAQSQIIKETAVQQHIAPITVTSIIAFIARRVICKVTQ
ncbi:hypothetical protein ACVNP1_01720 [Staphylococcus aureus]